MSRFSFFPETVSKTIRRSFPITDTKTFLGAASLAPIPEPTRMAIVDLASEVGQMAYLGFPRWGKVIEQTRERAARLVGASPAEIAFIRNTADGLSLVAAGIDWRDGDEILICDLEFPSNVYPWLNLEHRGVKVKRLTTREGRAPVELFAEAITEKTRLISLSTVQYTTGYRADLAAIGALCAQNGILFCVDAIQSLGLIPMHVKQYKIDFMACGGHKWLCAPEGIGIFYCANEHITKLSLSRAGWNTVVDGMNFGHIDFRPQPTAARFEEGTPNLLGIYGLNESMRLLMQAGGGIEHNYQHVMALNELLYEQLRKRGMTIVSPIKNFGERSGITIFTSGDAKQDEIIEKKLTSQNILVMRRGAGIRVAPHLYNLPEDIFILADALPI